MIKYKSRDWDWEIGVKYFIFKKKTTEITIERNKYIPTNKYHMIAKEKNGIEKKNRKKYNKIDISNDAMQPKFNVHF